MEGRPVNRWTRRTLPGARPATDACTPAFYAESEPPRENARAKLPAARTRRPACLPGFAHAGAPCSVRGDGVRRAPPCARRDSAGRARALLPFRAGAAALASAEARRVARQRLRQPRIPEWAPPGAYFTRSRRRAGGRVDQREGARRGRRETDAHGLRPHRLNSIAPPDPPNLPPSPGGASLLSRLRPRLPARFARDGARALICPNRELSRTCRPGGHDPAPALPFWRAGARIWAGGDAFGLMKRATRPCVSGIRDCGWCMDLLLTGVERYLVAERGRPQAHPGRSRSDAGGGGAASVLAPAHAARYPPPPTDEGISLQTHREVDARRAIECRSPADLLRRARSGACCAGAHAALYAQGNWCFAASPLVFGDPQAIVCCAIDCALLVARLLDALGHVGSPGALRWRSSPRTAGSLT
ncbi:hypothetical protein HYPSUDRAFT_197646 [Hypholoma sublateritium FD-334 SS-4]|uniref:Uncharacterized protein n=1 Tax=Hypholoma sublateritium (strain FD-334 SS-4) TaxID=945553 RepID=A0A0D2LK77_HYPSF|nr:hypothetical protein HYPSUDRAFT_197646 [Hypholoma sublateritium FD-334 SS-4]